MNRKEHLLATLAEDCMETAEAVMKALRFGLQDRHPSKGETNETLIQVEFAEAVAVMEMIEYEVFSSRDIGRLMRVMEAKKARVRDYMEYARETGALTD